MLPRIISKYNLKLIYFKNRWEHNRCYHQGNKQELGMLNIV